MQPQSLVYHMVLSELVRVGQMTAVPGKKKANVIIRCKRKVVCIASCICGDEFVGDVRLDDVVDDGNGVKELRAFKKSDLVAFVRVNSRVEFYKGRVTGNDLVEM